MIFVFKTSVKTKLQIRKLKPHIDNLLPNAKWNSDLEDIDKILRIDSEENTGLVIRRLMRFDETFILTKI